MKYETHVTVLFAASLSIDDNRLCNGNIIRQWLDVETPPVGSLFSPPLCELLICQDQNPPHCQSSNLFYFFQALTEVAIHFVTIEKKNLLCAIIYEPAY